MGEKKSTSIVIEITCEDELWQLQKLHESRNKARKMSGGADRDDFREDGGFARRRERDEVIF